jgi:hypothetical protein
MEAMPSNLVQSIGRERVGLRRVGVAKTTSSAKPGQSNSSAGEVGGRVTCGNPDPPATLSLHCSAHLWTLPKDESQSKEALDIAKRLEPWRSLRRRANA